MGLAEETGLYALRSTLLSLELDVGTRVVDRLHAGHRCGRAERNERDEADEATSTSSSAKERERKRRERNAWRRFARLNPDQWAEARNPDRRPELRPEPKPVADPGPKRGKLLRPIHFQ